MPDGYRLKRTGLPVAADAQEAQPDGRNGPLETYEEISGGEVDLTELNYADALQTLWYWVDTNSIYITDGKPNTAGADYPRITVDTSTNSPSLWFNDESTDTWVSRFMTDVVGTLETVAGGASNGGITIEGPSIEGPGGKVINFTGARISFAEAVDLNSGNSRIRDDNSFGFGTGRDITFFYQSNNNQIIVRDTVNNSNLASIPVGGPIDFADLTVQNDAPLLDNNNSVTLSNTSYNPVTENEYGNRLNGLTSWNETGTAVQGQAARIVSYTLTSNETLDLRRASLIKASTEPVPSGVDLVLVSGNESGGYTVEQTLISGDGSSLHNPTDNLPGDISPNSETTYTIAVDNGRFGSGAADSAEPTFESTGTILVT
jgi:hypothetical protein